MSDTIAQLSAAVASAAKTLPAGLNAKVEVVVTLSGYDLMTYLRRCYELDNQPELLEAENGSQHAADLMTIYDTDRGEAERAEVLRELRGGGIEVWRLRPLLLAAHLDGHLPKAKYVVSVSW